MLDEYVSKGGQRLRLGYTTGSCAAGAAKAAAQALLGGEFPERVTLMTPKGIGLELEILDKKSGEGFASCAVKKDGGDDPDVTSGILVYARAEKISSGVDIVGGEGIGIVTKAGLDRPVGDYAINTVPRKMINAAVTEIAELYEYKGGFRITVFAPEGVEIAKKTYNPRMGIEGGISIIGTSGIVEPMSTAALIDTIRAEGNMRKAEGIKNLVITPGNYGESFLSAYIHGAAEKCVKCSNFIGEAVDIAMELGFESVLIVGHMGKLVKLGAGIMNTHSAAADGRMEVLVTCGLLAGCDREALIDITKCAVTDGAIDIIKKEGKLEETMNIFCGRVQYYLDARAKGRIKIGALIFSNAYGVLGVTEEGQRLIRVISEEYGNG
ncbi:MAG: cobalt-precorrin-5B (C(1))-methyltransferase CbiD [Huintestinicola sp.]|uniref:cobalt-precorrin-5B (C(1))-methyltransferase CbiD n=1 Tax=Huintestinicola sp. TaxID=2981661 RepID=UPI003EFE5DB1